MAKGANNEGGVGVVGLSGDEKYETLLQAVLDIRGTIEEILEVQQELVEKINNLGKDYGSGYGIVDELDEN